MNARASTSDASPGSPSKSRQPVLARPSHRGLLHNYAAVGAGVAGVLLTMDAAPGVRLGAAVYTVAITAMFVVSAAYHRPTWGPKGRSIMRRLDHSAIYALIAGEFTLPLRSAPPAAVSASFPTLADSARAWNCTVSAGTYTPLCLSSLEAELGAKLLWRVWIGAGTGIVHSVFAPPTRISKVLSAVLYVALGWIVLPYASQLKGALGHTNSTLIVAGGIVYSLGAFIYAARWPNPFPRTWGYHEVFHLFITIAAVLHFFAVRSLVLKASALE